ncbi:MAG: glycoside hydrolase family 2 protein [Pontixanthobacter sp.]
MLWLRGALTLLLAISGAAAFAAGESINSPALEQPVVGPINASFPPAGVALRKDFAAELSAQSSWAMKAWVRVGSPADQPQAIATLVDKSGETLVELGIAKHRLFASAAGGRAQSTVFGGTGEWLLVSLAFDGERLALKVGDERPVKTALSISAVPSQLVLAPRTAGRTPFDGAVASLTLWQGDGGTPFQANWPKPNPELVLFESGSPGWPLQTKQNMGPGAPQDPATLPKSSSNERPQFTSERPKPTAPLTPTSAGRWTIGGWRFLAVPETDAVPEEISRQGFDDSEWLPATVPGTVLTSYVDNQVYPDPAIGLNNTLIPERLNQQDYWFRAEFEIPDANGSDYHAIAFQGINYTSEVWINGKRQGAIEGAFVRGRFDLLSTYGKGDKIVLAVKVSPPPNPGLPHEESLKAGPGVNGGEMTIDGPTFVASQGWDWIPSVRDRNTGIWQDVVFEATRAVRFGDPHVRTVLPREDNSLAELTLEVPVTNESDQAQTVTVSAKFDGVEVRQTIDLAPGSTGLARFAPDKFKQLRIENPKLWWPNGYGEPTLHDLALRVFAGSALSDSRTVRFGIREVSYELSLVDEAEQLQRVAVAPARSGGELLIDVKHQEIRKIEGGWALSLAAGIDSTPALSSAPETSLAPNILFRVNHVPIAVRGGNWGMDDWMKRVSRERLEPYFRLHRDANVNTIRNWVGQNTEQVFFELADEYGLLVLNDFWISTQDHNGEPGDTALFLNNAADTIGRFQYHPSIALWIGRNEGVPPPVLNTKLEQLVRELDGTRAYLPNSREVNMTGSGPWNYRPPVDYFTKLAMGFSTEIGTPSFPTLETFKMMMPEADQWPISDSWAYHDWHQGKAGDVASFMNAMSNRFGEPRDLTDFEKKAQLLNYESHRAIFEGMNAQLFVRNSGRLLWMTHPAWPSTAWQIYSYDYDTQASFFGAKKGMEPIHVQLNLPDRKVAVVNSLAGPIENAQLRISNYDLGGRQLDQRLVQVTAAGYATTESETAVPDALFDISSVVLTKLDLLDAGGAVLSENFYWLARNPAAYRAMTMMESTQINLQAQLSSTAAESQTDVVLTNNSSSPALMIKLSLLDDTGARILPAYWSDNYISLLPGESRTVTIRSPKAGQQPSSVKVDGWNIEVTTIEITRPKPSEGQ